MVAAAGLRGRGAGSDLPAFRQAVSPDHRTGRRGFSSGGQSESKRHGHVRGDTPDNGFSLPAGRRRKVTPMAATQTGRRACCIPGVGRCGPRRRSCDGQAAMSVSFTRSRVAHKSGDEESPGARWLRDAACAAEESGGGLPRGLAPPDPSSEESASALPAITRYNGLMTRRSRPCGRRFYRRAYSRGAGNTDMSRNGGSSKTSAAPASVRRRGGRDEDALERPLRRIRSCQQRAEHGCA